MISSLQVPLYLPVPCLTHNLPAQGPQQAQASSSFQGDDAQASLAADLRLWAAGGTLTPLSILPPFPPAGSALASRKVASHPSSFLLHSLVQSLCRGDQPATKGGKVWLGMNYHLFLLCLFAAFSLASLWEACHGRNAVH